MVHHHQIPVADEFYKKLGDNYKYIATMPLPDWLIKGGYDSTIARPYIVRAYENSEMKQYAIELAKNADVSIIGAAPDYYIEERIKNNKLTFRYSERYFKKHCWLFPDPRIWIWFYKNHFRYRNKKLYMLAASAYTANDVYHMQCYRNKVYKWGYFTKVDNFALDRFLKMKSENFGDTLHIMWCSRFLKWKHPELPVLLSKQLKDKGYKFHINMFGSGEELERIKKLASDLVVNDVVSFCGNLPNEEILHKMREHEIFLFTSDRNEGWGAVLNESMSNGCAVVASHLIGSVPFLIKDGENGLIFKSGDLNSLQHQVEFLLNNPNKRVTIIKNAILTMRNIWSPANAASRFLSLAESLLNDCDVKFIDGPCSKAYPI